MAYADALQIHSTNGGRPSNPLRVPLGAGRGTRPSSEAEQSLITAVKD